MSEVLERLYDSFLSGDLMIAPQYLLFWVLIAAGIYLWRKETGGFLGWLFPRAIWAHKSTRLDLSLFAIGQVMSFLGILTRFIATPAVATFVAGTLPGAALGGTPLSPITLALIFFVAADFATYWSHRAFHTIGVIWPLHAVHHSAAVLTPLTTYRQHPLGTALSFSFHSLVVGGILGVLVGVFDPAASVAEIAGVNAFVVLANVTVASFHHTHIWVSFGPALERLIISPAQHQVHHSTKPAHFNKNFGQILAIWDWMFGTLYLTGSREDIRLGLDGPAEAPLMSQRLSLAIWDPVRRMFVRPDRGR